MVAKLCLLSATWREESAEDHRNQDDYFLEAIAIRVGVAVWQEDFLRQDNLMAAADSALYEVKEAG
jgi:GGDEF domain-containing protein